MQKACLKPYLPRVWSSVFEFKRMESFHTLYFRLFQLCLHQYVTEEGTTPRTVNMSHYSHSGVIKVNIRLCPERQIICP